jgi:amino acid adenylation domain-containing protein
VDSAVSHPLRIFGPGPDAQAAYWRSRLAGAPALALSTDRPHPPAAPRCTAEHAFSLSAGTAAALRALARQEGASASTALLAVFDVLLARWSGQTDLVVGVAAAEGEDALPVRVDLAGDPSFRSLLARVQEATAGAFAHGGVPVGPLARELGMEAEAGRHPLFQARFAFDGGAADAGEDAAGLDLSLRIAPEAEELRCVLRYAPELFDAATAGRMGEHVRTLADAAAADPDLSVFALPMLADEERARIATWETEPLPADAPEAFPTRFAAQARRTPEGAALLWGQHKITYAELEARTSRLANHLRALGAGPEARVGVCLERTPELIVALLGVLRAGAAYVPLEPHLPDGRIATVLSDAGATLLITSAARAASLHPPAACAVLRMDDAEVRARIDAESAAAPRIGIHPESLAHVIYTSGSTGTPKGVMIRHRSVAVLLSWMRKAFPLAPGAKVLASTSAGFDVHVAEVHHTLASGGALVLARDALSLAELPAEMGVVQASMVPTAARELLRLGALPGTLRRLNLGGEPVPADLARDLYAAGVPEVHNLYGPTEDTTYSTHALIPRDGRVTIGRQIGGSRAYVLDARLRPAPTGVTGDLYLAGEGVSRGYLARPGMTAERYLPDLRVPGERMYATGDRARWRADGELEYFGRGDFQVKVRGYRIEPGEIEAVLRGHPGVADAVVAARGAESARRLVAWVTADGDAAPSAAELAEWAGARLPAYMVPAAFVAVDAFPRTSSGKVDRRALPDPDFGAPAAAWVAPRTPAEEVLAGIFADVLGVERIGAEDDFFGLGGHSLLATRVVSRVREAFDVELPLRAVFDAPTVARLAARIAGMEGGTALPPIVRVDRGRALPLSFSQQRLWFLEQLRPGGSAYNVPVALRLRGVLDVGALERTLGEIVRRHEALRTSFAVQGDEPVQVIAPAADFHLPVEEATEAELDARLLAEAERPFDLARGPLFRARLFRTAPDAHVLALTAHHAVTDGWSVDVLWRELEALYPAYVVGEPSPLPEPAVQYADFAVWQRAHLAGVMDAQAAYWKAALAGAPPALELPTDRPRPAVRGERGASHAFVLPAESASAVRALAQREGATLYMTLLAAFSALLGRYAGQEDVVVGSPVAGRTRAETEGLIGFFVNTLALRTDLSGDPGAAALLRRVREATLGAFAHQEVPFDRVVEELGGARDLSRTPVFQALFVLQEGAAPPALPGLEVAPAALRTQTARFDLALSVEEAEGGALRGVLTYAAELFDAATVQRMAGHLRALLEEMAADPSRRLSEIAVLAPEERAALAEWNATGAAHPSAGIAALFEGWAERTPDAPAVACEERTLSYAQANAAANRLAYHLRTLGAGPESRVGICLERGIPAIVALLGVLKSGAAYVPADPAWPAERIRYTLADAGVSLVLTTTALAELAGADPLRTILLDGDAKQIAAHPSTTLPSLTRPEQLAYVIYTSGSTGRPKGVMIEHRQLQNYVHGVLARLDLPDGSSFATVSTLAADLGNTSVFPALCTGGALHVVTHARATDPEAFAALMRRAPVDVLKITPSHLAALLSAGEPADVLPRARLVLGGEASRTEWIQTVRGMAPGLRIVNHYGPTETTVGVLTHAADEAMDAGGTLPLGRPLANARVYVLDAHGRALPVGVAGELCVGGAGVGRGYLARPGMTAERFVPDPYAPGAGARMYRTGDRARRRADGAIEFLGRVDDQVKIRGFRIEPGEVGAALARHPGIREAVVVARTEGGETRLAAYFVPAADAPDAAELRAWLRRGLPDAMVPSAFVALDALPLTANGKVDRRALPAPAWADASAAGAAPRTPAEEVLAGLWAELLGADRIGPDDDFFALGGHSLLATRMLSAIRRRFGVEVPVRALFEAPTLAGLAARIVQAQARGGDAAPPVVPVDRGRPLPLSFAQQRLWFLDQLAPGSPFYNMPYALRLAGVLDVAALERAIGALVARHESLRTSFAGADGEAVQRIAPAVPFVLAVEPVADEAAAGEAAREEALRPFDLAAGPLFRARVLRVAQDDHLLLLTLHHVIADGWSLDVLFRELAALYAAFAEGRDAGLPPLPAQYADYAVWQRRWLEGPVLDAQLAYWRGAMAGAPPALELPTDRPRPAALTFHGAVHPFHLPAEVAQGVRTLARTEGATVFMTLLAALDVVLARWSGQEDVVVGSPMAGRTRPELEGMVGFFVNTLPLRTDLGGDPSFRALLGRVRGATLGAYGHQELPFERLVDALEVARDPGRNPLFQVTFVVQSEPREFRAGGVRGTAREVESGTAKFDLTLAAQERADGLACAWEYNTGLFDPSTIERLTAHLSRVIAAAVADPARRIGDIDLLGGDERAVLAGFSAAPPLAGRVASFPTLFAARVRHAPDGIALVHGGESITYAELDARASRLANHLRRLGVGPDVRVGLCLERTPELAVAALAVLKAGGAYVPVEPFYPAGRIASIMRDAGAALFIGQAARADEIELPASCRVLALDLPRVRGAIDAESAESPAIAIHPDTLAHVIYTSGSTGTPKGVMIRHGGVAALLAWTREVFPVAPGERVLGATSFGFDVHVAELHHTLASGGTLVLVQNALSFAELPADAGIVQASMVPSAARELLSLGALPGTLRRLNLGGEPVPPDLARDLYAAGVPEVHNLYGPTEDTTYSTHSLIPRDGRVTVGRQIGGTRAYVLDSRLRPVPLGVVGDLYLAGAGVSRGYLARPGMTAERYVPDPHAPGERMYATGDRARWLAGGEIEYLGRADFQVKVRGFRIELGEIESVLRAHPAVAQAAVEVRGAEAAKRLVAYVVPASGAAVVDAELAEHLKARLPEYMVPSAFVAMEAFPRTSSGKLDRRALPEPDAPAAGDGFVAPGTPTEQALAGIWADVLGVERVGAADNFFALGGHSLLATRVVVRIRDLLRVEAPLRAIFDAPVLAQLARAVDAMERRDVLPPVLPVPRDRPLPLSSAQRRLWFLDQMEPGRATYNLPAALRLRGPLDAAALERALAAVVERHEALRTVFRAGADGEPVQVMEPAGGFALPVDDLVPVPAEAREAEARRRAADEAAAPFDLARGPLFRARLLRLAADDHVLLATLHHAVSDGWSMGVLWRELGALYGAHAGGAPTELPPLPVQYADFAAWERTHRDGPAMDAQLRGWRERLAGAPAALDLPADHPRPAVQSGRGGRVEAAVDAGTAAGSRALARAEGATLFMALLAAFDVLLARWSGQEDVVVGSPVAGRTRGELEGLIGFFVNTLPLRTDLSGEPTFRQLLARVRETVLEAHARQDVPLDRIVEALKVPRDPGRSPLFQAVFVLADDGAPPVLPGVRTEWMDGERADAKFDLTLAMREAGDGLRATLEYAAELFDASTAQRMAEHLRVLLDAAVADPDLPVNALPMLAEAERARIATWETEPRPAAAPEPFPVRFAAWAARTPDAVALLFGDERITYAQLDARASRIANHLRGLGAGPETRIGVCLERTPELVATLIGVLKTGAAYVPVEPYFPAERIASVLAASGAALLIASAERAASVSLPASCGVLAMDDPRVRGAIDAESAESPAIGIHPETLAHVIYTSGSTGTPKGVMIRHGGVGVFLSWMQGRFPVAPGERVLGSTSVAFDVHVAEVHHVLSSGATLVLVENALSLAELPADTGIVQASMVPSAARELLALGTLPGTLRRLNLGGEPVAPDLARDLYAAGVPEVHNLYGPTEDTTYSTHSLIPPDGRVTIGRQIGGSRAYVVDAWLRPVPIGVIGDLYLAGEGLSRGYLGRPDLTAEKYVPDPRVPGERMYATGDRARWRADGELEYFGRSDFQVKVRGFRIELGEIEAVLRAHPRVAEAVVVARGAEASRRLAAYVIPRDGAAPTAAELAAHLKERLPEYMVPAAFVSMDAYPRTSSGKVDRRALPEPETPSEGDEFVPPRTAAERALAAIWADALRLERVGATAHFFELGGHSLLATRVASRIRDTFRVDPPLRLIFDAPVLADLARHIEAMDGQTGFPRVVPVPRDRPLALSSAQHRLWFVDRLQPGSAAYNIPAALRLRGPLDAAALERAFGGLLARHEALRTVFAVDEASGEPVQVIHPPAPFRLPVETTDVADADAEALRAAAAEAAVPFDLARGPLFRARLLRLGADDHLLLVTVHHAVSDGWSMDVTWRELEALYAAHLQGAEPALPPLPVQYADYAAWEHATNDGPATRAQLRWWRERLAGAPADLELPADRPRPAVRGDRGGGVAVDVGEGTLGAFRALARSEGATLFMALLAAYQVLLARWCGQDDVVVGTPVAGRTRSELEGLIGFFVNMLPLRTDLSGDPTFRELLARVRDTVLEAHAHQDVPFDRMVEALKVVRDPARTPLFQVLFLLEEDTGLPAFPRLRAEKVEPESATAKFDLTLTVRPGAEGGRAVLDYAAELFDAATVERMSEHLRVLLDAVAADPDRRLSTLPLLADGERARIATWETEPLPADAADAFPVRFAAQARRTPGAAALLSGDERITYAELDARANRLANHLRRIGVGPEVRVGLCLERTPLLATAAIAVLKAGGAYVPVEPYLPADRIGAVLRDSGASLVLTTAGAVDAVDLPAGCHVLALDADEVRAATDAESPEPPAIGIHPDSLAHVIYTSGSTGTPKGVMIRHGGVSAFLGWMAEAFPIAPGERVLGATSFGFDVHVAELHHTLASGGTLVLVQNALSLAELPADTGIVQASMVPSAARELLALGVLPGSIRRLNLGGEPVAPDLARALYDAGVPEVHNLYGPTEDTTYSTHSLIPRDGRVTIGRQIGGTRAYVVDRQLRPVPIGVIGDLYLAGEGLSRGYLGRPDLTAERYVPDPRAPGERMYATGDRARWRSDGELEYFGRSDFQVKVRGFRIELGEIEAVLRAQPGVADAAVAARGAEASRRLVAYVIPRDGGPVDGAALAAGLRERLPEYMVPSAFVAMDAFPRTSSGKLDRRALPEPVLAAAGDGFVPPRTPTEEALAAIWTEVLGVDAVGATENFFDLGGHSLLATRVVGRVRDAFGVELPVRVLFEAPVLAQLALRIDAADAGTGPRPIRRVARRENVPLSFAQARLWYLDQLQPGQATYNMPFPQRLRGALDVAALERALGEVVRRHEVLRTTFALPEGSDEPVQVIHPPAPFRLAVEPAPAGEPPDAAAVRLAAEDAAAPFDLARGPLFRARLVRLDVDDHLLLVCLHHTASDGWSMGILWRELEALYAAFTRGETASPLPPLPMQYADFAAWERAERNGPAMAAQLAWWRERLAGAPAALDLPADHPRPAAESSRGGMHLSFVPRATADGLRALARREGATLFMTLLAAFDVLLARWSGQEDVVVGSAAAGRSRSELEGLIGFFVNALPLRTDLGGDPTFRELLARVRETVLEAYGRQDVPFDRLVEELKVPRDPGRSPLFQAMFLLADADAGPTLPGVRVEAVAGDSTTAKFDVTLAMREVPEGLRATLEYAADLFDPSTMERMAGHLRVLLGAIAADPDRRISTLPLLTGEERLQHATWHAGPPPAADRPSFPAAFAARVRQAPEAVAVEFGGTRIPYAELDARANRLANHLRRLGVGPEVRVGICLERTPELIVAALAVLKAGGAYVPVEPHFPPERIAAVMRDAEAGVLIATAARAAAVALPASCRALRVDADEVRSAIGAESAEPPAIGIHPETLAHVIYTSGSTGTPKGVMIRHGSVASFLAWTREAFPLAPGEKVLGSTSIAFDVHVAELHHALASGATLVLVENALSLAEMPRDAGIVQASMVPGAARELLALGTLPGSIRRLNLAGEALPADLARALYQAGVPEVHNVYGPTEDTTYSTHAHVPAGADRVTVGRPFRGRRAYVLDGAMRPAPVGVAGDLYLAGDGVARGYLGRPGMTAEKFVPDPFGGAGARMYATGDRARRVADGEIEYLGRADFQVKVRGFRIELGEIEAVLRAHPAVADAVALARDGGGGRRLVAYVVPVEGRTADAAELAAFLRGRLPEYMVPSALVGMEAFPRTTSGKLDRKALPEPGPAPEARAFAAPRTPTEQALARVWAEVLGVERVGADDNFFDLGGHSLLATRVMARIRQELRVELPLRVVIEASTLSALAARVDAGRTSGPAARTPIRAADRGAFRVRAADLGPAAPEG